MKQRWPRRTCALAAALAVSAVVRMAAANMPASFCENNPAQCYPFVGRTRAHFLGMLRQAMRAVPKVPGYRCQEEAKTFHDAYGRSARRAAPERLFGELWCFHRGTDPRKRYPDLSIGFELSMLPLVLGEGEAREKEHDLLVFAGPKGVSFVFGKIREWRDPKGVVHRGYDPSYTSHPTEEVVENGPFLLAAQVAINAESPAGIAALDAFAAGFDRAAVSALMAREERLRKADRGARSIAGVLQQ
jgi:hypothetical protein